MISEFEFWNRGPPKMVDFGIELFKTPEVLFQPSLVGLKNVGGIWDCFEKAFKDKKIKKVFVTGGGSKVRGLIGRIEADVRGLAAPGESVVVSHARDPSYDAWNGARMFAATEEFKKSLATKEEYFENGIAGLFKSHRFSNKYPLITAEDMEEFEF